MMMKNIWNPSHNEIRRWAREGTSLPHPHWAATLIDFNNLPVLIELAGDDGCKHQSFFQKCLYAFTGTVMEKHNLHEVQRLETTLENMENFDQPDSIREWIAFSQGMLLGEGEELPVWEMAHGASPLSMYVANEA
ncbi:hypothetical protein [Paenibacillus methanolicus]|uniref:Uncharacterized protein n=1 Tax=Paenibacillus methanolicus TaxID=582686 RepID=A0A5S5CIH6_9BACL|nr:hypothetical protein [Paenibacillus methanolicus]TYP79596.1 hypothetical protein BCM02_101716 [Paenibacillus methanolicus]